MANGGSGRRVKAQHFGDALLIEHDEIGGAAHLEAVIPEIRRRRARSDHVVERDDLLLLRHPKQMRGEERDLRHVVAAEAAKAVEPRTVAHDLHEDDEAKTTHK
jgi:hypothetical protein